MPIVLLTSTLNLQVPFGGRDKIVEYISLAAGVFKAYAQPVSPREVLILRILTTASSTGLFFLSETTTSNLISFVNGSREFASIFTLYNWSSKK